MTAFGFSTKFDHVDFVIRYEAGELSQDEVVEGFQAMIDSGLVWQLQGSYGRTARELIAAGLCFEEANSQ